VELTYIESVPEGPDAARIIRDLAVKGYDMIFTTSFGYMDPTLEVAQEFPDVIFEHCSGYKTGDNMSTYFGRMYQPRFLSGVIAGAMSKTGVIGYVAAFPIPEVLRGLNAFTLGAQVYNPYVEVKVVWTNTWYDPVKEREAAVALLDSGCDLITQHQDTTEPQKAAAERGMYSVGYDSDMGPFVGDSVLCSPVWNWGEYYVKTIGAAMDGTWETHSYWGGMADGVVQLAGFGPDVTQDILANMGDYQSSLEDGSWDVFTGPIYDQSGAVLVPEGEKMEDGAMLGMDFLVKGVTGSLN
jgi:basic membrane protein A